MQDPSNAVGSDLFEEHYKTLKRMAHARLRPHKTFTLLQTTSLVHESYLRVVATGGIHGDDHSRFLAYVGKVMRSVIVDAAREKLAQRRGEGVHHEEFDDAMILLSDQPAMEIMQVNDALQDLAALEPQLAKVLELEYFAGMTEVEIGECLAMSDRTVRRHSSKAHLMLRAMLA
jgi:RNA polymerase sigma factor (TIGR02999 family)